MRGTILIHATVSFYVYIETEKHTETVDMYITNKDSFEDIQKLIATYLRQQKGYKLTYEDIIIRSILNENIQ